MNRKKRSLAFTNPYLSKAKNLDYDLAISACTSSQIEGIFITPKQLLQFEKELKEKYSI